MSRVIPRVDISEELEDWSEAIYGEEVRSANVSALTKLQQQTNDACDMFEEIADDFDERDEQWAQDLQSVDESVEAAAGSASAAAASETAAAGSASAASASEAAAAASQAAAASSEEASEAAAERAEEAAESVESPVSYAPQTLTPAQQQQAAENIGLGDVKASLQYANHRNLLINPWFTVNQRDVSGEVTAIGYFIDCYKIVGLSRGGISFANNKVTISRSASATGGIAINQIIDSLPQGTYTLSAIVNNEIRSGTVIWDGTEEKDVIFEDGLFFALYLSANSPAFAVGITSGGESFVIKAVKLELGSVSTLANDVAPDYAEELLKCQRQFFRAKSISNTASVGNGVASTASNVYINVILPTIMRTTPTITVPNPTQWSLYQGGTSRQVSNIEYFDRSTNGIQLKVTSASLAAGAFYTLYASAANYIDISAEP